MLWLLIASVPSPSLVALSIWISAAAMAYIAGYLAMPACGAERQLVSDVLKKFGRVRTGRVLPPPVAVER
jgi:hypothetical protein